VAYSEDRYLCIAFLKQNGLNFNLFDVCHFSKIVNVVVGACLVESAEHFKADWVIMVAMNREYGQPDAKRWIQKISRLKALPLYFELVLFLFDHFRWLSIHVHAAVCAARLENVTIEDL